MGFHLDPTYQRELLAKEQKMAKVTNIDEIKVIDTSKPLEEFTKEIYDEEIKSYLFPCLKIETFQQLKYLFEEISKEELLNQDGRKYFIYRGQKDSNWLLESSLARLIKEINFPSIILDEHLENFRILARGKISDQSILRKSPLNELEKILSWRDFNGDFWLEINNAFSKIKDNNIEHDCELWAVGQHLGLKTPLLDWTYIFYIALFFTFEKEVGEEDISYRAVYRTNKCLLYALGEKSNDGTSYYFVPSSDPVGRITAQQGIFTLPYDIKNSLLFLPKEKKDKVFNIKFYINNNLRDDVLLYLRHLGIRFETIYPDIPGAVLEANYQLEGILKKELDKQKKRKERDVDIEKIKKGRKLKKRP